jgi:PilZ domain-containing protein
MKERRKYDRLSFPFPVRLETMSTNGKKVLDLTTKNISASGTFIPTLTSFPEGTRFILTLTFPSNKIQALKSVRCLNGCKGSLVRSTPHGIAIQFDRECRMECLKIL